MFLPGAYHALMAEALGFGDLGVICGIGFLTAFAAYTEDLRGQVSVGAAV